MAERHVNNPIFRIIIGIVAPREGEYDPADGELYPEYWSRAADTLNTVFTADTLNTVAYIASFPDNVRQGIVDFLTEIKETGESVALTAQQKATVLAIKAAKSSIQQLPVAFQQNAHAALGLSNNKNAKFQANLGNAYAATNQLGLTPNVPLLENTRRSRSRSRRRKLRKARRSRKN